MIWINIPLADSSVRPFAVWKDHVIYTAIILTVLITAFGSFTFPNVIWLCMLQLKIAIDLKLYFSMSLSVMGTAIGCNNHYQIKWEM